MRLKNLIKRAKSKYPFSLLVANAEGVIQDEPDLRAVFRQGNELILPEQTQWMPLPPGVGLITLPGCQPLGLDHQGQGVLVEGVQAVAATLPQGYTRLGLPAYEKVSEDTFLPLYGYTAVAWHDGEIWAAAHPTDNLLERWDPKHFNTDDLESLVVRRMAEFPDNRIIEQLAHCALEYHCYTAQNMFYRRWEAGIPVSPVCNAGCLGCISLQPSESCPSPQTRLTFIPSVEEIVEVASAHLALAEDAMVSFGQGCEGEPSMQYKTIAAAIREIRKRTDKGIINMNSNAGWTKAIEEIAAAGLDAIRVSINSPRIKWHQTYYQPQGFDLNDVGNSILICKARGLQVSLNYLVFPGISDRQKEIEALVELINRYKVDMVQLRNLNIDPDLYWSALQPNEQEDGPVLGLLTLIETIRRETDAYVGSFSRQL
ncbi:MAG: radical SAM protein [Firmicutes bacterium]|nr:radical SAM protein [Bacillota bacterium]